jgi:hypothetical protein
MCRVLVVSIGVVVLLQPGWTAALDGGAQAGAQVTPPRMMPPGQDAPKGTAVLRGTVVAADTGAPIRRAQVRAMTNDGQDHKVALTDDQGRFELRELVGGRYTVTASRTGFVSLQYGQRRPAERGTPVEVPPGQTLDKLAIALPRGGVIAGRIMDEVGEPLAEVQVQVLRSGFFSGGRRMMPTGRSDSTDDQGAFRIYGLQPGEYMVSATMRGSMGMMMPGGRSAPDVDQGYAPTYYPGTPSMSDAQGVTVGAGQEVSGIAFGLTPTRVARISGRVVGGPTSGSGGVFVMLMPEDPAMGFGGFGGRPVQADGAFEFTGVPPGRYVLQTQPRGRREADDLMGHTTVTVAGADLSGIVIPLRRPGTISGVFEFEGGVPAGVQPSQVRFQFLPVDPMARTYMSGPPETASDYTFSMRGLTSPVFVRVGAPPGWYLHSVLHDGEDITDTPLPIGPGVDVRGVRVRLTQRVSTVSGTVRDDRGQLVLDATVIVFPADDAKWGFASRFVRSARPDTQGRFEVRSLPAYANYRVVAVQGLEDGQMYDPEFLSGVRDRAERLALNQGEAKALDLRLRQ